MLSKKNNTNNNYLLNKRFIKKRFYKLYVDKRLFGPNSLKTEKNQRFFVNNNGND